MEYDPRTRPRNGVIPEERSGTVVEMHDERSVTLYGVEDWSELRDDPVLVLETVEDPGSVQANDTVEAESAERTDPTP